MLAVQISIQWRQMPLTVSVRILTESKQTVTQTR